MARDVIDAINERSLNKIINIFFLSTSNISEFDYNALTKIFFGECVNKWHEKLTIFISCLHLI